MTISLEEHVARANLTEHLEGWAQGHGLAEHSPLVAVMAAELIELRAAIAAVHEREGVTDLHKGFHPLEFQPAAISGDDPFAGEPAPDPADHFGPRPMIYVPGGVSPAPDPAEAMRAKTLNECEAIIRDNVPVYGSHEGSYMQRRREGDRMGLPYADAIAALKGNGEG